MADTLPVTGDGLGSRGTFGDRESTEAGPSGVWHSSTARAPTLCVRDLDGPALPNLRDDHVVRMVHSWRPEASLAGQSGGMSPCRFLGTCHRVADCRRPVGSSSRLPLVGGSFVLGGSDFRGIEHRILVRATDRDASHLGNDTVGPQGSFSRVKRASH